MNDRLIFRDLGVFYDELLFQETYFHVERIFGVIPEELDDINTWRNKLTQKNTTSHMIVCMKEDNIIGCALSDYLIESNVVFISYMLILEKYRKIGIGKILFDECIKATCSNNNVPVFIEINKIGYDERDNMDQYGRQKFWKQCGVKATDINYIQPPLQTEGKCYDGCVLAVGRISGEEIDKNIVIGFLTNMWRNTYKFNGSNPDSAENHPTFINMLNEIKTTHNNTIKLKQQLPWT